MGEKVIAILAAAENQLTNLYNGQSCWSREWAEMKIHALIKEIQEGMEIND